jgi:hypothetical protein
LSIDGVKEGQRLISACEQNKPSSVATGRRGRPKKRDKASKCSLLDEKLSRVSDDEDMQAPSSDVSYESDDESLEDWSICNFLKEHFGDEQLHNNDFQESILEQNEMPHGLHWDYSAKINSTSEKKMKPTPTSMKPGS